MIEEVVKQVSDMAYYKEPLYEVEYIKHLHVQGEATHYEDCYQVTKHTGIFKQGGKDSPAELVEKYELTKYKWEMMEKGVLWNPKWFLQVLENKGVVVLEGVPFIPDIPIDTLAEMNVMIISCKKIN